MAQVDYFLKLDGIEGESTDDKHKNEIAVESWSWGEVNAGTHAAGGGGGAGKVQMRDFHFLMQANKATPKLMLACATGQHIKQAQLTCRKAGGDQQEYLIIKLSNLVVSSYRTGAGQGDAFTWFILPYIEQDNLWKARLAAPWPPLSVPIAEPRGRGPFTIPSDPAAGWGAVGRHVALGDLNTDGTDGVVSLIRQADPWAVRMLLPADLVSLNFSKIEFEYKPQKADGSLDAPVKAGYDVKANKKV